MQEHSTSQDRFPSKQNRHRTAFDRNSLRVSPIQSTTLRLPFTRLLGEDYKIRRLVLSLPAHPGRPKQRTGVNRMRVHQLSMKNEKQTTNCRSLKHHENGGSNSLVYLGIQLPSLVYRGVTCTIANLFLITEVASFIKAPQLQM